MSWTIPQTVKSGVDYDTATSNRRSDGLILCETNETNYVLDLLVLPRFLLFAPKEKHADGIELHVPEEKTYSFKRFKYNDEVYTRRQPNILLHISENV